MDEDRLTPSGKNLKIGAGYFSLAVSLNRITGCTETGHDCYSYRGEYGV